MADRRIVVHAEWDPEAEVYVATSEDVPGLVAEGATPDDLAERLKSLIPELLELNAHLLNGVVYDRQAFIFQQKKESLVYA